jgi:riboflavin kinase/FMN adenylyltransferase
MDLSSEKLLPPKGVYVTRVRVGDRSYRSVTNVGSKPTVNNSNKVGVETHLLDYSGDLYGSTLCVDFLHFLRPERKFPSVDELKSQMLTDIEQSVNYYANIT